MANDKLFIPDRIKVGYQKREDTYNGNLAYVIYYDKKGVLRKETSWDGWRDKKIAPDEFDNQPTEGFVLNKGVGGVKYGGWNPRNEYIRVYDPRGFEFEISLANLLFILSEINCFKGKGLEGKFVYAWDGTELVLLPVETAEYKKSCEFTDLKTLSNIPLKELKYGATYSDAKGEKWVYLGKLDIIRPIPSSKAKKVNKESVPCFVSVADSSYGGWREINAIFSKKEYYKISFTKKVCLKVNDESEHPKPLVDVIDRIHSKENSKYFKKVKKLIAEYTNVKDRYSYDRSRVAVKDDEYYSVNYREAIIYTSNYSTSKRIKRITFLDSYRVQDGFLIKSSKNIVVLLDDLGNLFNPHLPENKQFIVDNVVELAPEELEKYAEIAKSAVSGSIKICLEDNTVLHTFDY